MNNLPDNLLEYVRVQYKAGTSPAIISEQLKINKWKEQDINRAINVVKTELQSGATSQQLNPQKPTQIGNQPIQSQATQSHLEEKNDQDTLLIRVFRVGFASIFLVNGLIALLKPEDFEKLLLSFPLAEAIGHIDIMIMIASINDLVLSGLILSGKYRKLIWAWAGTWFAMVSIIKFISLF